METELVGELESVARGEAVVEARKEDRKAQTIDSAGRVAESTARGGEMAAG